MIESGSHDSPSATSGGVSVEPAISAYEQRSLRREIAQVRSAIVFAAMLILGGLVFAVVVLGNIDWFIPTIAYFVACYLAWTRGA